MKYFFIQFLIILLLSGCSLKSDKLYVEPILSTDSENSNKKLTIDKAILWLKNYDGNWIINKIYTDFFPPDPDYTEQIDIKDDPFYNLKINIDIKNKMFIFNNDTTFYLVTANEVTSKELSWMLFAPSWGILAEKKAREICGGVYDEEGKISEGRPVKCLIFANNSEPLEDSDKISSIRLIISAKDELLLNFSDGGGTYILSRE